MDRTASGSQPSDPDRPPPPPKNTMSAADSYNNVYFETGNRVAIVNGEPRTSLITFPSNGRIPAFTPEGERRIQESRDFKRQFGEFDHPEIRPIAERCVVSYGSPAGPPMLPTTGYNSNYTIVQTADHVMIMTEMVHDARIVPLVRSAQLDDSIRLWSGDSRGFWKDDTLVVETRNFNDLTQSFAVSLIITSAVLIITAMTLVGGSSRKEVVQP